MKIILSLTTLAAVAAVGCAQEADLLIQNARIRTLNERQPLAAAMAVRNGRILAIGEEAESYFGASTKRIDARGMTVLPGFIDAHAHMRSLGELLEGLDLRHVKSIEEVAARVRQEAARLPAGAWIIGRNWDQTVWGGEFPDEAPLTRAAAEHPVMLKRVDGHAAWVNRKAMELAGITRATADPPGGRILRRPDGSPSGILIDAAQRWVEAKIPPADLSTVKRYLLRAARECARLGITSVHDAGIDELDLKAYRELIASGDFPVRVYAMIGGAGSLWREYTAKRPEIGEWLTVRAVKLYADGALGSRGARLLADYADEPGNRGLSILSQEEIAQVAEVAVALGYQVCTHAIGDRANREALHAYGEVLGGANDKRFRIEHAQVIAPEDFELFRKYSVVASVQPAHATSDMRWAEQRLGLRRLSGAYAWRSLLDLGVPVACGSDFPVESPNPLLGFYAAVTRQDQEGKPPGGWLPGQRMTRQEALECYTLRASYAAFEEDRKGSLAPGKYADFVLLDRDILTVPAAEILKARVVLTAVGGKIVHDERESVSPR